MVYDLSVGGIGFVGGGISGDPFSSVIQRDSGHEWRDDLNI